MPSNRFPSIHARPSTLDIYTYIYIYICFARMEGKGTFTYLWGFFVGSNEVFDAFEQVSTLPSVAPDSAWAKELGDVIHKALASPEYPRALLENLAHNHTLLQTDTESGGRSRHYGGSMNREEAVVKSISATLSRFREWPVGKKRPVAIKAGQFILPHARGICAMSSVNATVSVYP